MRTSSVCARNSRLAGRPLRSAAALSWLAAAACIAAAPAAATSTPNPPHYSLSIVEGVTTQPEYSVADTSGSTSTGAEPVVSIVRGGLVIAKSSPGSGARLTQVPNVGDVVNLEVPAGNLVGSVVYDGLPSMDPTVCAGSTNFSGQRSGGQTVQGGYNTVIVKTNRSGRPEGFENIGPGQAQVTLLAGPTFAGSFLKPLALGQTVFASESLDTPLAGGAVFTYESENIRPVPACPVPPVPPPPPPAPALQGSILKLLHTTIGKLLKFGWSNQVTINQPGTVTQDLYLVGGTLPAYASSRRHRKPPAMLLARGSVTAKSAGKVIVVLHPTKRGRHKLKGAKRVRAVLITTLRSSGTGAKLNLERRSVTLHR
jgi:hypothetical protein